MTQVLNNYFAKCATNCCAIVLLLCVVVGWSGSSLAAEGTDATLQDLQSQWAIANYELEGKAQKSAFETLLDTADQAVANDPKNPSLLIWRGIIKSTYAGVKGGLGALKYAKAAKADLEASIAIDPSALSGSAYTSLGTLYAQVPGWPIGFGNDDKAEKLLKKALELNPDGIDPNYFYAEFLRDEKNYQAAEQFYLKALNAPARPGREVADKGRRAEISAALEKLDKKK